MEDALFELLRNARDAGARNIYVASVLRQRRYRVLTVLDDGEGVDERYADLIFEPGVTTRHLTPVVEPAGSTAPAHGAGLSLYHIRDLSVKCSLLSVASPTSFSVVFDTREVPERSLQSTNRVGRRSGSNLLSTVEMFASRSNLPNTYYDSPAKILAILYKNHIIQTNGTVSSLADVGIALGISVSGRTARRILSGGVVSAMPVGLAGKSVSDEGRIKGGGGEAGGAILRLGREEVETITDILRRVGAANYVEVSDVRVLARPGEIKLTARVMEPEDEYE